jgi:hypothetical protein
MLFCRVSDTQYATIYNTAWGSPTVPIILVSKPPSGTANVITTVVDTAQTAVFPIINMGWSNIWIYNTTTSLIQVYGIWGNIIGTISGFSPPTSATLYYFMNMVNWRWVYLNGTNGTSRIVNFARMFYIGIWRNTTGSFQFKWKMTGLTGLVPGYNYYVQADGTIGNTFSSRYIGRWLTTTSLLIW